MAYSNEIHRLRHAHSSRKNELALLRWRFGLVGNVVGRIKVNRCRARLVLGWVTTCRRVNQFGM